MRLTDIPLDWLLPGAVLLLGALVAVGVLARGKRAGEKAAGDDWERSEDRRRRKEALYATASYVLLFCCAAVAAALSFHGLVGFGRQNLNLSGGWEYLVPFGLDGAAMFSSVLAVREASHGDAALGSRLLVWTFAGAAAWFNWVHAPRGLDHAGAPQFFSGMSLSAAVLFDRALKQTRRAALREQGLVPRPLPQIRIVRWLRAPRETFGAWSLMLLEGVRSLDEAVDEVRDDRKEHQRNKLRRREHEKLERAQLKAISRGNRNWGGRGGRQLEVHSAAQGTGSAQIGVDPAIPEPDQPRARPRPSLQAVTDEPAGAHDESADSADRRGLPPGRPGEQPGGPVTVDLTAEDDTQGLPRLDSLERKLKDLEQQFG
ncbi:DUF2637 domain-containing protein [Streptomyces tsukubensis]|uniref:DUF2637 domain-containing protein n=1 Tax=Streptomyces tsukubensis TaxID=83656 RepID=A0A1V4AB38_9ACTN|nr:DUF2637 domain-containing protein [Streptomyces tsukubensis]OON80649.1 hypothetical protein B1H18_12330 [Streptomyces tsukubensis]QFR96309.1 DUF2637 domain-containing protein [Streptomyces tsukubensis]